MTDERKQARRELARSVLGLAAPAAYTVFAFVLYTQGDVDGATFIIALAILLLAVERT
jgi:hypothetical protein